ncbi:hypothetical protein [Roseateles sp. BYS87W]|uniref:Secreted protein n=1 Tax=Pelomonas baiyunensis TaxID=3299026 RepID=A0ABW7H2B1_9BURK
MTPLAFRTRHVRSLAQALTPALASLTLAAALHTPAQAHGNLSETSVALSAAPLVLSVGAVSATGVALSTVPVGLLSAGAGLVVVSVTAVGSATVWVLERVSDGARLSLRVAGKMAEGLLVSAGTAVTVSVIGAGTVLSAAGRVVAVIPTEVGRALLHHEQVTR